MTPSIPDLINGTFELSGGFFILLSVLQTLRDKEVKGVSWLTMAFFTTWGFWNLYFYAHLDQWLSWAGGLFLVMVNTWWVTLILYYRRYPGGRASS